MLKVILKETINSLGIVGSQIEVASGYARNYLLPKGKAVLATIQNINIMKQKKIKFEIQIAKEKKIAEDMANKLSKIKCIISSKVHEENKLYGSVGSREIILALKKQNIEIDKKMILLKESLKTTGIFKIPVRIYADITCEINVEVIAE